MVCIVKCFYDNKVHIQHKQHLSQQKLDAILMGEVNRAYKTFDLNTESDLKPNTSSRFVSAQEDENTY